MPKNECFQTNKDIHLSNNCKKATACAYVYHYIYIYIYAYYVHNVFYYKYIRLRGWYFL